MPAGGAIAGSLRFFRSPGIAASHQAGSRQTDVASRIQPIILKMPMLPIGQLIKEELASQERTVSWFARKLHLDRSNVYRLFQKNSVDTDLLGRISLILDRDFFEELSSSFRERRGNARR